MTKSLFITLIHSSCVILSLIASIPGIAQVTADGTTSTTVTSPDGNNFTIDGGNRLEGGNNLFHSFNQFSVPTGGSAAFNNAVEIKNIFSRVTGGSISSIDGLIRANGNANLFLINPAGIMFGRNARLDIGGSFLGSTADSILFPEGEFNTVDLDNPPLLTINAPIGLGFRDNPGDIVNQAPANNGNGLEVSPGKNITLVGGDIELAGGNIFAPGGRVDLGGLSTAGEIRINADGSLSFPESVARADVTLTNSADINVRAGGGGSITINARNINLDGESGRTALRTGIATDSGSTNAQAGDITLNAEDTISLSQGSRISNQVSPTGMGNAGEIKITTKNLSLTQGGVINASTFGQGDAGAITIDATGTILVEGDTINSIRSGIFSRVAQSGRGNSGGIEITTTDLFLTQGGQVITGTFGQGNAGAITINASNTISAGASQTRFPSGIFSGVAQSGVGNSGGIKITTSNLSLTQGGRLDASTFGQGNAGEITINASNTISADGASQSGFLSGIFSGVAPTAVGNSGGIKITTSNLSLTQGGRLDASTFGQGDAGAITINASNTISAGASRSGFFSGIFSGVAPTAVGNSGGIKITTSNLSLTQGGRLDASTFGQGNAGAITINASNTISADGASQSGFFSGIFSGVAESGVGNSGGIKITTSNLSLTQGGTINASTFGQGNAGEITIKASNTISVKADSLRGIFSGILSRVAPTGVGNAGGIKITTSNLSLTQGGGVSASTFGQGDAGTINIDASDTIFVDGDSRKFSSGIYSRVAESAVGNSGGIKITTSNLSLLNDALITVQSGGEGNAGKLDIRAKSLRLENGASLLASTPVGTGGSITLQIADNSILREHSTISARATNDANGGNITIDADLIIAALNQNNDIIASAERGTGGKIDITAAGIFGLEERSSTPPNNTNDIDTSSQFGLDGSISIKIPDTGILGEEIEIPKIVEPKTLGTNACSGGGINANISSFEITGKGGIAPTPTTPLTADALVIEGKSSPLGTKQPERVQQQEIKPIVTAKGLIYPARGIIFKENGDIILTAYPTPNTIARTPNKSANCR